VEIFSIAAADSDLRLTPQALAAVGRYFAALPRGAAFGNARTARGVLAATARRQANRIAAVPTLALGDALQTIEEEDIPPVPTADQPDRQQLGFN
jgi:hypothetical protein